MLDVTNCERDKLVYYLKKDYNSLPPPLNFYTTVPFLD